MATTADVISQSSSINLIAKSISTTRSSLSSTNVTVGRIQKIIETKTKVRSDLFFKNQIIERRRREASKRREYEDQIEASKVTTNVQSGLRVASSSGQGPLSRILSFLGYLGAGWILENLPTWIAMGQEFIARMKKAGELIYSIPQTMWRILQGFGTVLKSIGTNIINLDFTDSSGEVRDSFTQLTDTIELLGTQIVDGFKLVLQPSGEVDIPSTGEQQPDTGFPEVPTPSPGGGGGGGGSRYGTKEQQAALDSISFAEGNTGYSTWAGYQKHGPDDLTGLTIRQIHDLQTSFINSGKVNKTGSAVVGRYQFLTPYNQAKAAGLNPETDKFSPSNQDRMAIHIMNTLGVTAERLKKEGISVGVADRLATQWASFPYSPKGGRSYYGQGFKDIKQIQAVYKKSLGTSQTQTPTAPPKPTATPQTPLSTNFAQVTGKSGTVKYNGREGAPVSVPYSPFKPRSGAVITSTMGFRRSSGTYHKGYDLAAASGTPLYAYFPGKVTHIGLDGTASSAGYGNWVVWKDDVYGAYHFFGHMKDRPPVRVGQSVNQGTLMGAVGSTGVSTGPHLHWEISNNPPQSNGQFTSYEDPGSWLRSHPLKKSAVSPQLAKVPSETSITPTPSAESKQPQISSATPQQQRQVAEAVTQERMGQQFLFIDDRSAPQPSVSAGSQKSYGGGGASGQITEFDVLNNFMKQKLLLDFNYL